MIKEHIETNCAQKQQNSGEIALGSTSSSLSALASICIHARDHWRNKRTATVQTTHNGLKTGKGARIEVT